MMRRRATRRCRRTRLPSGAIDLEAAGRADGRQADRIRAAAWDGSTPTDSGARRPHPARRRAPRDLRHPARPDRPRFHRLQGAHVSAPGRAAHAGARSATTSTPMSSGCATDRQEVVQLFHDLLIGVTAFFRDRGGVRGAGQAGHPGPVRGQGRRGTRCASGCRAARPARRRIRSRSCCSSTWRR